MFDVALRWAAIDGVAVALLACLPGALIGLALGASIWRANRAVGAVLGAAAGLALNIALVSLWHVRLPIGGISAIGWPAIG